jgi:RNA polymerase sigma-70 factor (ECF subfamily)
MPKKGRMGHADDEDAAAAARVVAGDPVAFDGIVRRWQHRLVGLAWRFCRDRARAEDMAQEAFLKAYRSLSGFRGESSFGTWLTAVAVNTCRSRLRSEGPPLVPLDPAASLGHEPGTLQRLADRQREEAVRRAVLTLPERYRDALVVYYFHEMDVGRAAATLAIAEGTLKARLHRGRELLRRRCEALGLAPGQGGQ